MSLAIPPTVGARTVASASPSPQVPVDPTTITWPNRILLPRSLDAFSSDKWTKELRAVGFEVLIDVEGGRQEGNFIYVLPPKYDTSYLQQAISTYSKPIPGSPPSQVYFVSDVIFKSSPSIPITQSIQTYRNVLAGVCICPTSVSSQSKRILTACVQSLGGRIDGMYQSRITTHLIAAKAMTDKYRAAYKQPRPIFSEAWVEACFREGRRPTEKEEEKFRVPCLLGATITSVGFSEADERMIKEKALAHGARYITHGSAYGSSPPTHIISSYPTPAGVAESLPKGASLVDRIWLDFFIDNPGEQYKESDFPPFDDATRMAKLSSKAGALEAAQKQAAEEQRLKEEEQRRIQEEQERQEKAKRDEIERQKRAAEAERIKQETASREAAARLAVEEEARRVEQERLAEIARRRENEVVYDSSNDHYLDTLQIFLVALDSPAQTEQMQKIIRFGGGTRLKSILGREVISSTTGNANTTNLVVVYGSCTREQLDEKLKQELKSKAKGIASLPFTIVNYRWLLECYKTQSIVPFTGFELPPQSEAPPLTRTTSLSRAGRIPSIAPLRSPSLGAVPASASAAVQEEKSNHVDSAVSTARRSSSRHSTTPIANPSAVDVAPLPIATPAVSAPAPLPASHFEPSPYPNKKASIHKSTIQEDDEEGRIDSALEEEEEEDFEFGKRIRNAASAHPVTDNFIARSTRGSDAGSKRMASQQQQEVLAAVMMEERKESSPALSEKSSAKALFQQQQLLKQKSLTKTSSTTKAKLPIPVVDDDDAKKDAVTEDEDDGEAEMETAPLVKSKLSKKKGADDDDDEPKILTPKFQKRKQAASLTPSSPTVVAPTSLANASSIKPPVLLSSSPKKGNAKKFQKTARGTPASAKEKEKEKDATSADQPSSSATSSVAVVTPLVKERVRRRIPMTPLSADQEEEGDEEKEEDEEEPGLQEVDVSKSNSKTKPTKPTRSSSAKKTETIEEKEVEEKEKSTPVTKKPTARQSRSTKKVTESVEVDTATEEESPQKPTRASRSSTTKKSPIVESKAKGKKNIDDDDEEEEEEATAVDAEDEEEESKPKSKAKAKAKATPKSKAKKKKKKYDDDDEEEEDDDEAYVDEEEEEAPKSKKSSSKAKSKSKKPADDEEEEVVEESPVKSKTKSKLKKEADDDEEEEAEAEEALPAKSKTTSKSKKKEDEAEATVEAEETPAKPTRSSRARKSKKKDEDDEDGDDDEYKEEEEEEEKPKSKKKETPAQAKKSAAAAKKKAEQEAKDAAEKEKEKEKDEKTEEKKEEVEEKATPKAKSAKKDSKSTEQKTDEKEKEKSEPAATASDDTKSKKKDAEDEKKQQPAESPKSATPAAGATSPHKPTAASTSPQKGSPTKTSPARRQNLVVPSRGRPVPPSPTLPVRSPSLGGFADESAPTRKKLLTKKTYTVPEVGSQNEDPFAFSATEEPKPEPEARTTGPRKYPILPKGAIATGEKSTETQVVDTEAIEDELPQADSKKSKTKAKMKTPADPATPITTGRSKRKAAAVAKSYAEIGSEIDMGTEDPAAEEEKTEEDEPATTSKRGKKPNAKKKQKVEEDEEADEEEKKQAATPSSRSKRKIDATEDVTHFSVTPPAHDDTPVKLSPPRTAGKRKSPDATDTPAGPAASPIKRSLSLKAVESLTTLKTPPDEVMEEKKDEDEAAVAEAEEDQPSKKKQKTSTKAKPAAKKGKAKVGEDATDDAAMDTTTDEPESKKESAVTKKAAAITKPSRKRKSAKDDDEEDADDAGDEDYQEEKDEGSSKAKDSKKKTAKKTTAKSKQSEGTAETEAEAEPASSTHSSKRAKKGDTTTAVSSPPAAAVASTSKSSKGKSSKTKKVFTLTGIHSSMKDHYTDIIKSLGASIQGDEIDLSTLTHIVCQVEEKGEKAGMKRSEKVLVGLMGKQFLVHQSFLDDSKKAGEFVDEKKYEWIRRSEPVGALSSALKKWYGGSAPYADWRVFAVGLDEIKLKVYRKLLESGGGKFADDSDTDITHILINTPHQTQADLKANAKATHNLVDSTLTAQSDPSAVIVARQEYLTEFLARAGALDQLTDWNIKWKSPAASSSRASQTSTASKSKKK